MSALVTDAQLVEVLLPLPLTGTFTYSVPEPMRGAARPGMRVVVPFGRKKFYTGIVVAPAMRAPEGYEVKPIEMVVDDTPVVRNPQLKLWEWVGQYYLCSTGEVYRAAVPSGLKMESETWVEANPDWEEEPDNRLGDRETMVLGALLQAGKRMSVGELGKLTGFGNITPTVTRLMERGAVVVSERIVDRYRPRRENYVRLTIDIADPDAVGDAFAKVKGALKQETALLALIDIMRSSPRGKEITRKELLDRSGITMPIVKAMQAKGLVEAYHKEINRFSYSGPVEGRVPALTPAQSAALDAVHKSWLDHEVALLHGVTSSGKTEIYIHLIDFVLRQGRQALMLVPEIALTTQLTARLQRVFGDKVIIYHSRFTDNERVDIWRKMLATHSPCVVIGARSAIFLPFASLGLVIVDEEHESSYKQTDPAPRYNGRDTAIMLARMHSAKTLLGSATPAIDTYYKAQSGRYGLVTLTERYEGMQLPSMQLVDLSMARKRKQVSGILAVQTREIVREAVDSGRQAIIFLNRRGYAPVAECGQCGYIPKCETCDVSLTFHKRLNKLVCHYCGTQYPMPSVCPACREPSIQVHGYGTERLEDDIADAFADVPVSRLDLDTTRARDGYDKVIGEFSQQRTKILVGTQMVTKGLDFAGVSAVAVVNADAIINYPDFRSNERAFNMLEQVAGRAGRRGGQGTVAVQTYNPAHPLFNYLVSHDYRGFYAMELEERRLFNYPPFTRIIYVYIKHRDERELDTLATIYAAHLRELLGTRVHGPDVPAVARVQSLYIRRIMLKVEVQASMARVKEVLRSLYEQLHAYPAMRAATVYYDVDPA